MLGRREVADEVAHARVQRLFAAPPPVRGWVPADVAAVPRPSPAVELVEASWAPREEPDPPPSLAYAPALDLLQDGEQEAPEGDRLPGLLPDTLRGGRLDPGRRGAVALLLVLLLAAAAAAAAVLQGRPQEVLAPVREVAGEPLPGADAEPSPGGELVVSVAGAVVSPGVVRLPPGSRVDDAVRAAGGLQPGASVGLLNLARRLTDGEQVLVGVEPPPGTAPDGSPAAAGGAGGPVDLNSASAGDLDALPGIGPVLAARIVAWRTEHGPFRSVDQLREVPGIGESKYSLLEPEVVVR